VPAAGGGVAGAGLRLRADGVGLSATPDDLLEQSADHPSPAPGHRADGYSCTPEYRDGSVIPFRLEGMATEEGVPVYSWSIDVW